MEGHLFIFAALRQISGRRKFAGNGLARISVLAVVCSHSAHLPKVARYSRGVRPVTLRKAA